MLSRYVSSNKSLREPLSRNRIWMKPTDQMDLWLDSQGFYRKHTAKDGSCLYRAVSEQIFLSQAFHLDVRRQCAEFAQRHPELLSSVTHCTVNEYVEQMKHPYGLGGKLELELMSQMYRKDFLVVHEVGKPFEQVTNNGFDDKIMLCLSQDRHYDSVYSKKYISKAAFCQSLVYEMLYKGVFQLLEVDYAVGKMLHDKTSKYQKDPSAFFMNGLASHLEIRDSCINVKELLQLGVTPFPYKVAKSLDPDIYRNVEYDTWNDIRRGLRFGMYLWSNRELQVGVKCLVKLESDRVCHAHIQEMSPNKGPVLVFVEELGEKMTVAYEDLELLPQPTEPQSLPLPLKQLKQLQTIKVTSTSPQQSYQQEPLEITEINEENDQFPDSMTSEKEPVWRPDSDNNGRITPKIKMFGELAKLSKKSLKNCRSKMKDQPQQLNTESGKSQMEANSAGPSSDYHYEQEVLNYHRENFEEYNPQGFIQQETNEQVTEENNSLGQKVPNVQPCPPPTVVCLEHQPYYIPNAEGFQQPTYCFLPHKPVVPDGSHVPIADMGALRFYYNYGVDHYSRGVRPTPPCYLNTTVAYIPEPAISPSAYDHSSTHSTPDSAVMMSPVGMYAQRPNFLPVLQSPGGILCPEPDSTTYTPQNLAPRFKNKIRATQARSFEQPPVIQQPEVSSTTNIPMPAPLTHFIPPPVYYRPMDCEPYNYVEYSMYDPATATATAVFYPPAPPPHPHYIPDPLFYQHVLAPPIPPPL